MLLTMNTVHLPSHTSTSLTAPYTVARTNNRRSSILSGRSSGICKKSTFQHPSPATSNLSKLEALLPEHIRNNLDSSPVSSSAVNSDITCQRSPRSTSHPFFDTYSKESLDWSMHSPPRSDSATASVIPGGSYPYTTASSGSEGTTTAADMSTLGYMMPPQYGHIGPQDPSYSSSASYALDQPYRIPIPHQQQQHPGAPSYDIPSSHQQYSQNQIPTSSPTSTFASSNQPYHAHNPYGLGYGPMQNSVTRSMSSPMPAATMAPNSNSYAPQYDRSPSLYDTNMYTPHTAGPSTIPSQPQNIGFSSPSFSGTQPQSFARSMSTTSVGSASSTRITSSKAKPQCFDHGCNGREFSTFSNLLRHQREKSGSATKSFCPRCGAEFTRTTARNGHLAHDKCSKQRRPSEGK